MNHKDREIKNLMREINRLKNTKFGSGTIYFMGTHGPIRISFDEKRGFGPQITAAEIQGPAAYDMQQVTGPEAYTWKPEPAPTKELT